MEHDEKHDAAAQQPDEPQTPMWLPMLGGALFLVAGIYWATRPVYHAPQPEPVASTAAVPSAAPSAPPADMRHAPPMGVASARPMPSALRGRFR
jgi:hypothetical protein